MNEEKTLFERLYEASEGNLAHFAKETLSHPTFAAAMEKAFRNAAATKGKIDRNMEILLGLFNLPSKADYTKLLAKVEAIQGSMVNLNIKLDRLIANTDKKSQPVRRVSTRSRSSRTQEGKKKKD
jgi:hypothetical protein